MATLGFVSAALLALRLWCAAVPVFLPACVAVLAIALVCASRLACAAVLACVAVLATAVVCASTLVCALAIALARAELPVLGLRCVAVPVFLLAYAVALAIAVAWAAGLVWAAVLVLVDVAAAAFAVGPHPGGGVAAVLRAGVAMRGVRVRKAVVRARVAWRPRRATYRP
ncbi:hypothetical protein [Nonomuraea monospora]|uniref:hypothetical protein n=1 Tax=Nonomuraea monospora TaxID=568818 RepID=UPI0031E0E597